MSFKVTSLFRNKICVTVANNEAGCRSVSTFLKLRGRNRDGAIKKHGQELLPVPPNLLLCTPKQNFHILTTQGILFEALQKSHFSENDFKIPEELKRLKAGSMKWLFEFWPSGTSKKLPNFSNGGNCEDFSSDPSGFKPSKKNDEKQLHQMVDYLKEKNFMFRRLIRLPWLLTANPEIVEASVKRVQRILRLKDFEIAISFVNFSEAKLLQTAALWRHEAKDLPKCHCSLCKVNGNKPVVFENRIDYMAHVLQCPKEDVSDMMTRGKGLLMTWNLQEIESVMNTLLDGGVKPEAIINDPWIFQNKADTLQKRIRILNNNGITDFKPWILRKPQLVFEKFIERQLKERDLRGGHKDIREFLQTTLNCSEEVATRIMKRVKSMSYTSITKANEVIQFLYSAGYTAEQIAETPRVLAHSVKTISSRWNELRFAADSSVITIHMLCRPEKEYRSCLRKIMHITTEKKEEEQNIS